MFVVRNRIGAKGAMFTDNSGDELQFTSPAAIISFLEKMGFNDFEISNMKVTEVK